MIVAIDLSKAFDCVQHDLLFDKMRETTLPGGILRWLLTYMTGRTQRTQYLNATSSAKLISLGVPQGSVISPTLFNFYVADIPEPPPHVRVVSYADDFTVFSSDADYRAATTRINSYLPALKQYFEDNNLQLSAAKSSVCLHTPDTKQARLDPGVHISGTAIPPTQRQKILGITFDTMFSFAPHTNAVRARAAQATNILKAIAGSD